MKLELLLKGLNKTEDVRTEEDKEKLYYTYYVLDQVDGETYAYTKKNTKEGKITNLENKIKITLNKKNEVENIEVILTGNNENENEINFFDYIKNIEKTSFKKNEITNVFRDLEFLRLFSEWHFSREKSLLSRFKKAYKDQKIEEYNSLIKKIKKITSDKKFETRIYEKIITSYGNEKEEIFLNELKKYNEEIETLENRIKELQKEDWCKIILIYSLDNSLWFLEN